MSGPTVDGVPGSVAQQTSRRVVVIAFAAVAACALLTVLIFGAMANDVAWEQEGLEKTVADAHNQDTLWMMIFGFTIIGTLMTGVTLGGAINSAAHRVSRVPRWLAVPLVVNLVLCIGVWWFGLAAAPTAR